MADQLSVSVLLCHLLVEVVHGPEEELSQLARQVAQASNWRLVHRSTRLQGEISQKIYFETRIRKILTPGSARLAGR